MCVVFNCHEGAPVLWVAAIRATATALLAVCGAKSESVTLVGAAASAVPVAARTAVELRSRPSRGSQGRLMSPDARHDLPSSESGFSLEER
jgi:hypothetical protein